MKTEPIRIATAVTLVLASFSADAFPLTPEHVPIPAGGVFSMYSQGGLDTSGVVANFDAPISVDATIEGFVNFLNDTWSVYSFQFFYGLQWTASNGQLITSPGDYRLDTATGVVTWQTGQAANDGGMHFTVGANQMAGVIDFAWGASSGIRVVNVWDINPDLSLTAVSVAGMENGPFLGFNAAFDFGPIAAIPEASTYSMMLAGIGLVWGIARRSRRADENRPG